MRPLLQGAQLEPIAMFTLIMFAIFISACCAAAAGLIASAQNEADGVRSMTGLDTQEPQI